MSSVPAAFASRIIENMRGYAIVALAEDGTVTGWLADAEALTGYSRDEAVGMNIGAIFTEADRAAGAHLTEIRRALDEGRFEDSRWHLRKNGERFWANGLTLPLLDGDAVAMKVFRDETPLKRADDQRILLLNELNHRVKNSLATVQSVVDQTLRSAGVDARVRNDLTARIMALSSAHNVLVDQNWAGAELEAIVRDVTRAFDGPQSRLRLEGPLVQLHPSQAVTLSLVLHELVTNAAKYGALSVPQGNVEINWNLSHDSEGHRFLTLLWRERDGPPVTPPTRAGFGTRLLASALSHQQGGARVRYDPEGVCAVLSFRLVERAPAVEMTGEGVSAPA
ncbi:sensor histidine kinase [Brevundimonas sp.]|uniref:sensor histidine kinase n=1 Tax=Brevundimonas sp. TaxID=1871086 RepID=UPI002D341A48|nr:HWE histidine kinase domain-containing protein [Brevundimonas sp.]HYD26190.1 HWE histidine kinase domain-containing protein [Brevundimonas sp.]